MHTTHVDTLDTTIQKTNQWLKALQESLGASDRQHAYLALRATLHALRDRLPPNEVLDLGAQMPILVRGIYYEGWRLADKPARVRTREDFLRGIADESGDPTLEPERAARAVFRLLSDRISGGEIADVRHALPAPIRELWPA